VFSDHASVFYDFVDSIDASTAVSTFEKDNAQMPMPMSIAPLISTEATPYKADVTSPAPVFYYYDMILKHEMAITGIYIFGDAAIVTAAGTNTIGTAAV
jgi:hypothetical protein